MKGEQAASFIPIFSRSDASIVIRASVESLCCGLVGQVCEMLHRTVVLDYSDVTGADKVQRFRMSSVIPLPRVRPPL